MPIVWERKYFCFQLNSHDSGKILLFIFGLCQTPIDLHLFSPNKQIRARTRNNVPDVPQIFSFIPLLYFPSCRLIWIRDLIETHISVCTHIENATWELNWRRYNATLYQPRKKKCWSNLWIESNWTIFFPWARFKVI